MQGFSRLLARFRRNTAGVAVIEFALIVPIMLAVYVGCSEAATLLTVDRKVQSVAGAVGDLVARSNKSITAAQLQDYLQAATSIMTPYEDAGLVQTITAVSVADDGETTIQWSVRYVDGVYSAVVPGNRVGDSFDLPQEMTDIAAGQTVISAEADYSYTPLVGIVFQNAVDLHRSALFMPRYGGTIDLE